MTRKITKFGGVVGAALKNAEDNGSKNPYGKMPGNSVSKRKLVKGGCKKW